MSIIIIVFCPTGGNGWVVGEGLLGNSSTASGRTYLEGIVDRSKSLGRRDFCFLSCPIFGVSCSRLPSNLLLLFLCGISFLMFPGALFEKTHVHEFQISYSHTKWYWLLSDSATAGAPKRIRREMAILKVYILSQYTLGDTSQSTSNPVKTKPN